MAKVQLTSNQGPTIDREAIMRRNLLVHKRKLLQVPVLHIFGMVLQDLSPRDACIPQTLKCAITFALFISSRICIVWFQKNSGDLYSVLAREESSLSKQTASAML